MRHGQPRQVEATKLWHFAEACDGRIYPVGYCRNGCIGHATEEEAREHFAQWQRDQAKVEPLPWDRPECQVTECSEPARFQVRISGQISSRLVCDYHSQHLDQVLFGSDYATS